MEISTLTSALHQLWHLTIISVNNSPITVANVVLGCAFMVLALKAARKISELIGLKVFPRMIEDSTSRRTVQNLMYYALVFVFSFFALNLANIPLTAFAFLGGALAIGVGFGSQNVVNNFFSGIILMIERPVKVGDYIEVDGIFGRVQDIGFRSTRLLALRNRNMIVPNSSFLEKNVLNWTLADEMVRSVVKVGVAYGSDIELVREKILQAVREEPLALDNPQPIVVFQEFGDNSLNFEVDFSVFLHEIRDMHIVESNIRFRIDKLFSEAGIVIAFPQRDVHLDTLRPIPVQIQQPEV